MNKKALTTFFTNMYASAGNFTITVRSISGSKDFTAWEWNLQFNLDHVMEEAALDKDFAPDKADGREIKMRGVSLTWWNEEGKIIKNNDYGKVVESFDEKSV
jgi:hypothetical protein